MLLAFHKPYGVLSQFTPDGSSHRTLAEFDFPPNVYPLGRLDADSEGLLLLTDEPSMNSRLLDPLHAHERTYWTLVERVPTPASLAVLQEGVVIEDRKTRPCRAQVLDPQPELAPRDPPVRYRKNVPDVWLELALTEGRNRQVRKMTAAIGHPTLRLIRVRIGNFPLNDLPSGKWRVVSEVERRQIFSSTNLNRPLISLR
ncbi:MAG TPA: pseudouridine synthase [Chthoniobacterales bacterium]